MDGNDRNQPDEESFWEVAELFRLLGDGSRARVFWILCHQEECVDSLASITGMSCPAVSHHLRLLRKTGLIQSRRIGKEVRYRASSSPAACTLHEALERLMEITCPRA